MKDKKVHLEIIRLLAISLVVFNHTDGYFLYYSTTHNILTYSVSLLFSILCRINVPLFFMVTGALLLDKEESIKELYTKRVMRIAVIIVLFSAVQYVFLGIYKGEMSNLSLMDFFSLVYTGKVVESYWFLYAYLAILMMLPFLRKMAKLMTVEEFHYLFILKIVLGILFRVFGLFTGKGIGIELFILTDSVFYVLAGYYMEKRMKENFYQNRNKEMKKAEVACVAAVILSIIIVTAMHKNTGVYLEECLTIFTPVIAITVYFMVKSICTRRKLSIRLEKIVIYAGSTVFGIYLIEKLVRRQLLPVYLYLSENTVGILACFCYVTGTLFLAFVYVSILKKIPGIRKWI